MMKWSRREDPRHYSGPVRSLVLLLGAALCALAAAGCGGGSAESTATPTSAPAETGEPATTPARELAPTIEGTSLDGEPVALTDYRGQAVLINVWSSW